MRLICPECKNEVDLSAFPDLAAGYAVECNYCGISLQVTEINDGGEIKADIMDEGK